MTDNLEALALRAAELLEKAADTWADEQSYSLAGEANQISAAIRQALGR